MKALLCTIAALGIIAFTGTALAEGGCYGNKQQHSAEAPPPPPPPAAPAT